MTVIELEALIDKKIAEHNREVDKVIEDLERKVETLTTEIMILKQGSNI